jgi:PBP1b-binding outer membrane lipoprotein LpoB
VGNNLAVEILKMSLLSNKQHISQEYLLRYVQDDCSRAEMREIDRHLATCPMCSEAIEGLLLLPEPTVAIAQLNKRIDGEIAEKIVEKPIEIPVEKPILEVVKRPFWQQRWAAAAAVLLLASGSVWVYKITQKSDNEAVASAEIQALPNTENSSAASATLDSLNQTPQYEAVQKAKRDEIVADLTTSSKIVEKGTMPAQQEVRKKTNTTVNKPTPQATVKPSDTDIAVVSDKSALEKRIPQVASAPATYSVKSENEREIAAESVQSAPQTAYQIPTKEREIKVEESETGNKQADKSLKEVVMTGNAKAKMPMPAAKRPPSVSTAYESVLSRADDNYNKKNYQAAVADYTQFLAQETEGEDAERAFFQLANCYLKLNKKADAKVIFEKLSATNGQYQRPAKKALKDL